VIHVISSFFADMLTVGAKPARMKTYEDSNKMGGAF
jgi:hypothetical protein